MNKKSIVDGKTGLNVAQKRCIYTNEAVDCDFMVKSCSESMKMVDKRNPDEVITSLTSWTAYYVHTWLIMDVF